MKIKDIPPVNRMIEIEDIQNIEDVKDYLYKIELSSLAHMMFVCNFSGRTKSRMYDDLESKCKVFLEKLGFDPDENFDVSELFIGNKA